MGFLDKVKATAQQAAEKAQEGIQQGQEKLNEAQEKRKSATLLRDLGAAYYLDKTGKGNASITGDIERLLAELRDLEASGVTIDPPAAAVAEPPAAPDPPSPPAAPAPPAGAAPVPPEPPTPAPPVPPVPPTPGAPTA